VFISIMQCLEVFNECKEIVIQGVDVVIDCLGSCGVFRSTYRVF